MPRRVITLSILLFNSNIMANTYTQIHIQCVMAVKFRHSLIDSSWKDSLHKYITGIVQNNGHKVIAINTMPDHLHLFFGMRPNQSLSDLMRIVKGESSERMNKEKLIPDIFRWQEGYGAFSYARSQVKVVGDYVRNQEQHHRKKTFAEEYESLLKLFEVDFDKQYVFKPLE
jgi:putative transposase